MDILLQANEADVSGNFREAVRLYEDAIKADPSCCEAVVNLSFICWQCTEPGFSAHHHLSAEFIDQVSKRKAELLQESQSACGDDPELRFWGLYFDYMDLGAPIDKECCDIVRRFPRCLVPYFFLFAASHGHEYREETRELLESCVQNPTFKNRFIRSVIESRSNRQLKTLDGEHGCAL